MPKHSSTAGHSQLTRTHKFSLAGVAALGAAALAVTLVPGQDTQAQAKDETVAAAPVAFTTDAGAKQIKDVHASVTSQQAAASEKAKQAETKAKARKEAEAKKKAEAEKKAQAAAKAKAEAQAEAQAKKEREAKQPAARAPARKPVYANNLDGWIKESLAIMKDK